MATYDRISSDMVGCLTCKVNTHSSLMLMPSHLHRRETRHLRITSSLHTPVRVCSFGIEAAIAMHASPSFRIAVTDKGTNDGADINVLIEE